MAHYARSRPGSTFNALEPGTTATDVTAAFEIGRPVEASARVVVRLTTLDPTGPTGTFQDERQGSCPGEQVDDVQHLRPARAG
jgi:hypothetical protein